MISFLDVPGFRKLASLEPAFASELASIAENLGLNPSFLAVVMSLESLMQPGIQNSIGATGLIQFMPSTAKILDTSVEALKSMSGVQQLTYVMRYFAPFIQKIRPNEPGDYYMAVFMPAYLGSPRETVLGENGSPDILPKTHFTKGQIYSQNAGLDVNHDGVLTVGDVMAKAENLASAAAARPRLEVQEVPLAPAPSAPPPVSAPPSPSLPPAWRSFGGHFDLPVLRVGVRGTAVTLAQALLGCDLITGVFTEAMAVDYVRPFQSRMGLTVDAVIGRQTWQALSEELQLQAAERRLA